MKRRANVCSLIVGLCCMLLAASPAGAWCFKEHIEFARLAAERLIADPDTPPAMRDWLRLAVPQQLDAAGEEDYFMHTKVGFTPAGYGGFKGILQWVYMPDVRALGEKNNITPFGAPEAKMHFIDLEVFLSGDQPRQYRIDLSGKPSISDIPYNLKDPRYLQSGFLPLRVDQCYHELVTNLRANRLMPTDASDENNAMRWAGYLAHYSADNTQPHHNTLDYKSVVYFADKRNAPNVHAQVEYAMCDGADNDYPALRKEFWPLFVKDMDDVKDPADSDNPFTATLQVSMYSYDALPLIGEAAMEAAGQGGTPDHPVGKAKPAEQFDTVVFFHHKGMLRGEPSTVLEMKASQTALAVRRIERLWKQAWVEAYTKPATPSMWDGLQNLPPATQPATGP
jgi:hypothetical protein